MRLFALPLFLLLCHCAEDETANSVLASRDLTPLERRIVGTWGWGFASQTDTVEFRDDLTFEGVKDGAGYSGTFILENDSVLQLTRILRSMGAPMTEYFNYRVLSLDDYTLRLSSAARHLVYTRTPPD